MTPPCGPATYLISAPAAGVVMLTGPGGAPIAAERVRPLGVPIGAGDIQWGGDGWLVPWGRWEIRDASGVLASATFAPDFHEYLGWWVAGEPCADVTTTAVPGAGYGVPDGVVGNEDLFWVLGLM